MVLRDRIQQQNIHRYRGGPYAVIYQTFHEVFLQ